MNLTMKRLLFTTLLLPTAICASAQTLPAELAAMPERAAGIYHSYEAPSASDAVVPEGYTPFYISHYGRHGSRWHTSEPFYATPLKALRQADEKGVLTARGRELLDQVCRLAEDAGGRYGDLSPRGAREHRDIARRMYAAWPEVFSTRNGRTCTVDSRATVYPRCILSMAAFNEGLKELNPEITTLREASKRNAYYLANQYDTSRGSDIADRTADSLRAVRIDPARFLGTLFTDPSAVDDPVKFMSQIFNLAGIAQDVDYLGIDLYDLFDEKELYALWECENARRYLLMGPSIRFGDTVIESAKPLLRNIVETAQRVIDGEEQVAASLRFGHDVYLVPLLALLQVEGASERVERLDDIASNWSTEKITPMAANIQFVFLRNAATGDIRVRILHNERDAVLPIPGAPYYEWPVLKKYCEERLEADVRYSRR